MLELLVVILVIIMIKDLAQEISRVWFCKVIRGARIHRDRLMMLVKCSFSRKEIRKKRMWPKYLRN